MSFDVFDFVNFTGLIFQGTSHGLFCGQKYYCDKDGDSHYSKEIIRCSDDSDDSCNWSDYAQGKNFSPPPPKAFGTTCNWGGNKVMCSNCDKTKAKWCRTNYSFKELGQEK